MTLLDERAGLRKHLSAAAAAAARLADTLAVPPPPESGDDRSPASPRWRAQSLAKGAAGIAVLHGARAAHDGGERVHAWLVCANREELSVGAGAGLWYGAPAVAFAVSTAAPPGQYGKALEVLDGAVATLTRARLDEACSRMAARARPSLAEFDLTRGLTGLGAYLLRRAPDSGLLRQVLAYLVQLTEPLLADDEAGLAAPGWWTSDIPPGRPGAFDAGYADVGMAHGIAGPLALLALAARQGVCIDGQVDAIERICSWLESWRHDGPAGPWWPERLTLAELRAGRSSQSGPARPSWCYGTPGVARAQHLAAIATGNLVRQRQAEQALVQCLADPVQLARIVDPALCHGWAGLIATAWHAASDAVSPELPGCLLSLLDTLLERVDGDRPSDMPGLIEGTAGTALTLHTLAAGTSSGWERCLLIN
jgi:hypothetical protein